MTARSSARAATARPAAPRPRPRPQQPQRRPAPAPRPRVRVKPKVMWGVLPVVTLLLGGIVWINVAKLQLTRQSQAVTVRANQLQSENIRLNAQVGEQGGLIPRLAQKRLGMLPGTGSNNTTKFLVPPHQPLR